MSEISLTKGEKNDLPYLAASYHPYRGWRILGWRHTNNDLLCWSHRRRNRRSGTKICRAPDEQLEIQQSNVRRSWPDYSGRPYSIWVGREGWSSLAKIELCDWPRHWRRVRDHWLCVRDHGWTYYKSHGSARRANAGKTFC